jgi:hypothetical protein
MRLTAPVAGNGKLVRRASAREPSSLITGTSSWMRPVAAITPGTAAICLVIDSGACTA